jgi:hypothetical protein
MNRYRSGGPSKATSSTLCQKCLKRGHFSYECTASQTDRPYISRPSRTQQLANPKLAPKITNSAPVETPKYVNYHFDSQYWSAANVTSEYPLQASSNPALLHVDASEASTTLTRLTKDRPRYHHIRAPTRSRLSRPIDRVHARLHLVVLPLHVHIVAVHASVADRAHVLPVERTYRTL